MNSVFKILPVIACLAVSGARVLAQEKAPPPPAAKVKSEKAILKKYDIYKLNEAATLLMAAVDESASAKDLCGIDSKTAAGMTESIHALIDQKIEAYIKEHKKKGVYSEATWSHCATACACGVETSILEKVDFEKLRPVDKTMYRQVSNSAMAQEPKDVRACAAKSQWLCKSDLMAFARQ